MTLHHIDIDEALRYMGCPPERTDPATRALTEESAAKLLAVIRPRWTWKVFDLTFREEGVVLDGGIVLTGRDIRSHLAGCRRAVVFCATLGAQADRLIRQMESVDMARALAVDCCAAAAVEQICDRIEEELAGRFPGCWFHFRYSPGYGDLPLTVQNDLLAALDAPRAVGLTASDHHILIPRKSVTAILGIADQPVERHKQSCLSCAAQEHCIYRKSGGHCGIS